MEQLKERKREIERESASVEIVTVMNERLVI